MTRGHWCARVERNLEASVAQEHPRTHPPEGAGLGAPLVRAAVHYEGELWTALVTSSAVDGSGHVTFIRDWIVGGTRRVIRPLEPGYMKSLLTATRERRSDMLSHELREALVRPGVSRSAQADERR